MRKTIIAVSSLDGYVRFDYQGCLVKLRAADWYAALDAGKAETRALHQARRASHQQAVQDATTLRWLDEES